jgi:hypothetical protein
MFTNKSNFKVAQDNTNKDSEKYEKERSDPGDSGAPPSSSHAAPKAPASRAFRTTTTRLSATEHARATPRGAPPAASAAGDVG